MSTPTRRRYYPSQVELKTPLSLENTFKKVLDRLYEIERNGVTASNSLTKNQIAQAQKALQSGGAYSVSVVNIVSTIDQITKNLGDVIADSLVVNNTLTVSGEVTLEDILYVDSIRSVSITGSNHNQISMGDGSGTIFVSGGGYVPALALGVSATAVTLSAYNIAGNTDVVLNAAGTGVIRLQDATYVAQLYGSDVANGDITIEGTSHGTKTTSYVILQPTGGNVGIGTGSPSAKLSIDGGLHVGGDTDPGDNNLLVDGTATITGLTASRLTATGAAGLLVSNAALTATKLPYATAAGALADTAITTDASDVWFVGAGTGLPYGSCGGDDIAWSHANAAQNTWYLISDASIVTGQTNLVTHDNAGKLTLTTAGRYLVTWSGSFESSAAAAHVEVGLSINGADPAANVGLVNHIEAKAASTEEAVAGTGIISVAAGSTIELAIRTTNAGTPTLTCAHYLLSAVLIGG